MVAAAVVVSCRCGFREQEEFKVVDKKRVRIFEDNRRERKKRLLQESSLSVLGVVSIVDWDLRLSFSD